MAIESLSILTDTGTGHAYLAEQYGKVVENIDNGTISGLFKNQDLSGDPNAGTVKARRLANAELDEYGTARSGGAGKKIKNADVDINLNKHKELIEEVEDSDARTFGVEGLVERRLSNHQRRTIKQLEKEFWAEAVNAGTEFTPSAEATTAAEKVDEAIVEVETTQSQFVDGVDRSQMGLILSPSMYTKLQENIDTIPNAANGGTYQVFHNVRVYSSTDLPSGIDLVVITEGAIAQPVHYTPDEAGKIPMSNAYHFGLFLDYGTKAVSPEVLKYIRAE